MKMKRLGCLILIICLVFSVSAEAAKKKEASELDQFSVRHGSRNSPKIAITMDDCYELEYVWKSVELCRKYGVTMTFFPIGIQLKEKDRDNWRKVLDAGCEIGSHTQDHNRFSAYGWANNLRRLGRFQESLDRALGYHYETRWLRPPFGSIVGDNGRTDKVIWLIKKFGFKHVLLWDVTQTKPDEVMKEVQNGSILLFHARKKDYKCIEEVLPQLLEAGYQPVTVSELFGFDPPKTSKKLYVYNAKDYTGE